MEGFGGLIRACLSYVMVSGIGPIGYPCIQ